MRWPIPRSVVVRSQRRIHGTPSTPRIQDAARRSNGRPAMKPVEGMTRIVLWADTDHLHLTLLTAPTCRFCTMEMALPKARLDYSSGCIFCIREEPRPHGPNWLRNVQGLQPVAPTHGSGMQCTCRSLSISKLGTKTSRYTGNSVVRALFDHDGELTRTWANCPNRANRVAADPKMTGPWHSPSKLVSPSDLSA